MKTTKMLFYCTMGKPYLYKDVDNKFKLSNKPVSNSLNGKVVAECEVETEEIRLNEYRDEYDEWDYEYDTPTLSNDELLDKSCLNNDELDNYITNKHAYALHIKNLKIFDNPKLLRTYCVYYLNGIMPMVQRIQKAPQNMMRVYDYKGNPYIVISIRSPWLCKISNGEKEVEVRKKVLKEML